MRAEASGWPEVRLADLCDSIDYGYTASSTALSVGPKFLRITDIVSGFIDWDQVPYCKIEESQKEKYRLHPGDVVIARTGATTGYSAYISDPPDSVFASYLIRLSLGPAADARFISYFLKSPLFWTYMRGVLGDKSAQPNASARTLTQVKLRLPSIPEQVAVAEILGAFDDRIGINRAVRRSLENMARAIFKSWFVDFDPVREGHSLFPRSFQESALGRIPKGWKLGKLEDLLILQRGFDLPMGDRRPGTVPVIAASGPVGFHDEARVKGPGVVTGRSGVLGKVFLLLEDFWPLNTSLWIKEFRGSRPIHAYHLLQMLDFGVFNAGSAVPTLNRNHVNSLPVIVPPLPVVEYFEQVVSPLFALRDKNEQQSKTLTALRNTLLPKLLSGEIRVKQAEKLAGEVI